MYINFSFIVLFLRISSEYAKKKTVRANRQRSLTEKMDCYKKKAWLPLAYGWPTTRRSIIYACFKSIKANDH